MTAKITFYPLGDADCSLIELADGRMILVDYGNEGSPGSIDLSKALRAKLKTAQRDYLDAVVFTHFDRDHTLGASDFFWFDHAATYQGKERIRVRELWVPAAGLYETGLDDCARVIRQEARYRFSRGYGIRVFSRPDGLRKHFETKNLDVDHRENFLVNAGEVVPGFSLSSPARAEFFVHCPFGWRQNEREVVDRNQDSVVFQAVFMEGSRTFRVLFASDIDSETISEIVKVTSWHGRNDRLCWDLLKIPHHCSYLSLSPEKGRDTTTPVTEVAWLLEKCGQPGGILLSSSRRIPLDDADAQPPHRQAANYYKKIARQIGGQFQVTMENSPPGNPQPSVVSIGPGGLNFASGANGQTLLRAATPASAAFTFPNRPVAPTKPSGFA